MSIRLNKAVKELNIGSDTAVTFLKSKGHDVDPNPNTKLSPEQYDLLLKEYSKDADLLEKAHQVSAQKREEKEAIRAEKEAQIAQEVPTSRVTLAGPTIKGKIELNPPKPAAPAPKPAAPAPQAVEKAPEPEAPAAPVAVQEPAQPATPPPTEKMDQRQTLGGLNIKGKVDLDDLKKPKAKAKAPEAAAPAPAPEAPAPAAPQAEAPAAPAAEAATDAEIQHHKTQFQTLDGPRFTGQTIDLSQFNKPAKKKVASSEPASRDNNKRKRIAKPGAPNTPGQPAQGGANRPGGNQGGQNRPGGNQGGNRRGAAPVRKEELTEEQIQAKIKETLEQLTTGRKSKGAKIRRDKRAERREQDALSEMERAEQSKVVKVTEYVTVADLATMMSVSPIQIISACMQLGIMVTQNQRLDAETLTLVAEEFGYTVEFVTAEVQESLPDLSDQEDNLLPRAPIVTVMGHVDHGKTSLLDYIRKTNVIAGEAGGITQHIGAYTVELNNGKHITFLDTPGHEAFTAMRARGAQVTDVAIIVVAADDAVMPQTKEAIAHAQAAGVPFVFAINKVDKPSANPEKIKEQLAGMNLLVEDWGGKIQNQELSAKTGKGIDELLEKVLLEAEILDLKANPDRNANGTVIEASLDKGRGYVSTILVQGGTLRIGDVVLAGTFSGRVKAMLDERGHKLDEAGPSTPVTILGLDGAPTAGDRFQVLDDEREARQVALKRQQLQREQSVRTKKTITLDEIGRRLALGDFKELNIVLKGDVDGSIEALADSLQKLSTEEIAVNIIHKAVGGITESDVLLATASNAIIVGFQVRPSASARKLAEKEDVDIRLYSIIYDAINEIKDAMEGMLSPEMKEEITCNIEVRETFKISKVGTIAGCMVMDGTINRNSRIRLIRDGVVVYTGELGSLKRFKDDVKEVSRGTECGLNIKNFNDIKVGDIIEGFKEVEVKKTLD